MGPQVRMAGSLSINKRKTSTRGDSPGGVADAPDHVGATLVVAPLADALRRPGDHKGRPYILLLPDFHGFARWWPYGPGIAADEKAQDGMPRTDYNVAHCLGGTGS